MFRMINKQGIDCLFKFKENKKIEIANYCKWLNWDVNHASNPNHLFMGNSKIDGTMDQMVRMQWNRDRIMYNMSH